MDTERERKVSLLNTHKQKSYILTTRWEELKWVIRENARIRDPKQERFRKRTEQLIYFTIH